MALFRIYCPACGLQAARLAPNPQKALERPCGGCGAVVERVPTGLSSAVMETLDNGAMAHAVTRLADAERLYKERADQADPLAGRSLRHDD